MCLITYPVLFIMIGIPESMKIAPAVTILTYIPGVPNSNVGTDTHYLQHGMD